MIPYGRQEITEADIEAVVRVLRSDFLTQGPAVPEFEEALAGYCGAQQGVAVNSATSALHIACLALDLGPGDIAWTSPITFAASANCALHCGASVDFVDIDAATCNMCVDRLAQKLAHAASTGRLPKVVIPVHLGGEPCDMRAVAALATRYGFKVIEDASHAIGGSYRGHRIGGCQFSDITVFSFHPVKTITSGEGGMAMTNDAALAARMRRLRSHGITRDPAEMDTAPEGPWFYQQVELGFNFRMTDLQAALGRSQLHRIDDIVARRHRIAQRYDLLLEGLPLELPRRDPRSLSGMHLYVVRIDPGRPAARHAEVFAALRAAQIGVNLHYIPVYLHPWYRRLGFAPGHCPQSERYYAQAISLPMYPGLSEPQQDCVVAALHQALAA